MQLIITKCDLCAKNKDLLTLIVDGRGRGIILSGEQEALQLGWKKICGKMNCPDCLREAAEDLDESHLGGV